MAGGHQDPRRLLNTVANDREAAGKVAVITGAAGGLGRAIASRLNQLGYRLVLLDRDQAALEAMAAGLSRSIAIVLDISDGTKVAAVPSLIPAAFQPVDVLINNAGHDIGGKVRFDVGDVEDWAAMIETNLIGLIRVTHSLLPALIQRNQGHIVNVGSMSGIRLAADMAAYSASKAGVHTFSDILRADLADTAIRVTEIMPGLTRTNIILSRMKGDKAREEEYFKSRMSLSADDVARSIVYALDQPAHVQVAHIFLLPTNRF